MTGWPGMTGEETRAAFKNLNGGPWDPGPRDFASFEAGVMEAWLHYGRFITGSSAAPIGLICERVTLMSLRESLSTIPDPAARENCRAWINDHLQRNLMSMDSRGATLAEREKQQ